MTHSDTPSDYTLRRHARFIRVFGTFLLSASLLGPVQAGVVEPIFPIADPAQLFPFLMCPHFTYPLMFGVPWNPFLQLRCPVRACIGDHLLAPYTTAGRLCTVYIFPEIRIN